MLCLRWVEIPDVCHATRDIRSFQVSSTTIPCHVGGQAADCLDCSAECCSSWIMKAQAAQLPVVLLPVGRTKITAFSQVQIFDSFVQKRIN